MEHDIQDNEGARNAGMTTMTSSSGDETINDKNDDRSAMATKSSISTTKAIMAKSSVATL